MIFYANAEYIGESNDGSGFVRNNVYCLEIKQTLIGYGIQIAPTHGYQYRTHEDYRTAYPNMQEFLRCWKPVSLENPNLRDWQSEREDYYAGR